MIKLVAIFAFIAFLSLVFHFVIGGDTSITLQQQVISFSLKDRLVGFLLLSNLFVVILLLRKRVY